MKKNIKVFTSLHKSTNRNYIKRMNDNKVYYMKLAKKYSKDYWDGSRKSGYGGYKYIPDYLKPLAKKIIKIYKLSNKSKILDIGCGKGFLLYEIKKILPKITIRGFDISKYAIKNSQKEIRTFLNVILLFLSGNSLTPITKINIDQINHVKIAVNPESPIDVLIILFAAIAPATPSRIIIRPAKYIAASPKYLLSE